ncbi:hypothetical protein WDW89_20685 [Deltaproteobacteria bacterium TL4]
MKEIARSSVEAASAVSEVNKNLRKIQQSIDEVGSEISHTRDR